MPPPDECYQQMGFQAFAGGPHLTADEWRRHQGSQNLHEIRQRYLWLRDCAGQPLVDHGHVVGWVPPQRLAEAEFEKLLSALDEGLAAGCTTVQQWQAERVTRALLRESTSGSEETGR
jgi:hypothetical protein